MASKSAKRRLARAMPLNADPRFQLAAAMEENFEERGKPSWIDPQRGLQIDGEAFDGPQINHEQRSTVELLAPRDEIPTAAEYFTSWNTIILGATNPEQLAKTWGDQIELRKAIKWDEQYDWRTLQARVRKAVDSMRTPA